MIGPPALEPVNHEGQPDLRPVRKVVSNHGGPQRLPEKRLILHVLTTAGVLKGEIAFADTTGPVTIPNVQFVALLGGETDFKCRAFYSLHGLRSMNFDEITVLKGES